MSQPAEKKGWARIDDRPSPVSLAQFRDRVVTINLDPADDDPADLVHVGLKYRSEVHVYIGHGRSVVVECQGAARVDVENYGAGVSSTDVFRPSGLEEEAVVAAKALEDHFLIGADDAVASIDVDVLASEADNHASHEFSPSVGAPAGAVCDNPNPTDGDSTFGRAATPDGSAARLE